MVRTAGKEDLGAGILCSLLLHGLAALLLLFGLPQLLTPPPEMEEPIVVDIETIADKVAPPPRQVEEPKPEEPTPPKPLPPEPLKPLPPEPPKPIPPEPPKPIPPEPPKPIPPEPPKPIPPEPEPVPVPAPKPKPEPPKEQPKPQPDMLKDIKPPPKKPPPPDDFDNLLKSVDKLRQTSKPQEQPAPKADKTVRSPLTDSAAQPTTTEKNYVAAQIWPKWNVDLGAKGAETLQVNVRISVTPDGRVVRAVLDVDPERYKHDTFFQAAADAAQRAVLQASPLRAPPTRPDFFKNNPDLTINFDPRSLR